MAATGFSARSGGYRDPCALEARASFGFGNMRRMQGAGKADQNSGSFVVVLTRGLNTFSPRPVRTARTRI